MPPINSTTTPIEGSSRILSASVVSSSRGGMYGRSLPGSRTSTRASSTPTPVRSVIRVRAVARRSATWAPTVPSPSRPMRMAVMVGRIVAGASVRPEIRTMPRQMLRPTRTWLPVVAVLVAHLGLAFALFAPAWAHPTSTLIGGQLDSAPHTWLLAWPSWALAHGHNPLFSDWICAPTGANLAWSTQMTLPGVAVAPIKAAAGPVVAFNLVLTLGPALTAFAAYLLARRFGLSHLAAAAGGALAGFTPYVVSHAFAGHANLVIALGVPLVALVLDAIVLRQRRSPWLLGVALGVLAAAQVYIAEEILATEVVAAAGALAAPPV